MVDIQSPTAEIRRRKKKKKKKEEDRNHRAKNIMVCPITYDDPQRLPRRDIDPAASSAESRPTTALGSVLSCSFKLGKQYTNRIHGRVHVPWTRPVNTAREQG